MASGAQKYIDEYKKQLTDEVNKNYEARKQSDEQTVAAINDIETKAAQSTVDRYQGQIDAAPGEYHETFAKNELAEALGRRRAELKMANMGMTDSGLSETSQAALSVQKNNANATARRDMQNYVKELESKINDVWATRDAKVASETETLRKNTDDWYNTTLQQVASAAQEQGVAQYNAEQQAAAEVDAARIKAQQEANDAAAERNNEISDSVFDAVIKNGGTVQEAMAARASINPYSNTINPDTKYGVFANGYQPDNFGGKKLFKSGDTDVINGDTQDVWYTTTRHSRRADDVTYTYYIWDEVNNVYQEYDYYA